MTHSAGLKSGAGTLRIAADNPTYTGNFDVTGGTLQIGNNGGVGDAGSGTVTLSGGGTFVVRRNGGTLTINNTITGTGNVRFQTRNFTGTINKANTYTGNTTLEPSSTATAGGIRLGIDNGLPTNTPFTINTITNGAPQTFNLNGFDQTLASLASGASVNATNSIITNSVAGAKTLTISNASGSTTYAGLISGNISLTKSGASTQVLTANNTFTGGTTVSAGTLVLSGGGSINGSSLISVSTGATLTNNSTVSVTKALALEEGSLLAGTGSFAGSSLAVIGDLAGGSFASINLGATFTKPGSLNLSLSNVTDGAYALFSGTAPGGSFTSVSVGGSPLTDQGGGIFSANIGGVDYAFTDASNLLVVAVPEPGTWVLVGIGLTFLLYRKRARLES